MTDFKKLIFVLFPKLNDNTFQKILSSEFVKKHKKIIEVLPINETNPLILKQYEKERIKHLNMFIDFESEALEIIFNNENIYSSFSKSIDKSVFPEGINIKGFDYELLIPVISNSIKRG